MNLASRKFATFLAITGLSAFLLVHLFGADGIFGMETRKDGTEAFSQGILNQKIYSSAN